MPLIREAVVITVNALGEPHIAPLGLIAEGEGWILAPFHPSTTLDNLRQAPFAVANFTDDVRVFAGCLTGRRDWPLTPATLVAAPRLATTLSHLELVVVEVREHELRPRFVCRVAHHASHAPFQGFNRAQAAVIEGAVLVSRLASPAPSRSRGRTGASRDRRGQDSRTGGGRGLDLAQGQGGAGLRRRCGALGEASAPRRDNPEPEPSFGKIRISCYNVDLGPTARSRVLSRRRMARCEDMCGGRNLRRELRPRAIFFISLGRNSLKRLNSKK